MYFALFALARSLSLSEFCGNPTNWLRAEATVDELDIPFQECARKSFQNYRLTTTYQAVVDYSKTYRTLRVDNGLTLAVTGVTSGDILDVLDVGEGTIELNLADPVVLIDGNVRVDKKFGARLVVKGGSLRTRRQQVLRVIHTNDIHCALDESEKEGYIGWAKYVNFIKEQRAASSYVLALDTGDYIQGMAACAVTNGSVGVEAIIRTKYDAMVVGNHFFDFGHDVAVRNKKRLDEGGVNVVCANVLDESPGDRLEFNEYVVKTVGDLRVGIFGLITPYTKTTTSPATVENMTFAKDLANISKRIVETLRNEEGCDVVILVGHLGYEQGDYSSDGLARQYDGIDLIVDGHSHTEIPEGGFELCNDYQTMIVQAGTQLQAIGVADLLVDAERKRVVGKKAKLLKYADFVGAAEDAEAKEFLEQAEKEVEVITSQVIGHSAIDFPHIRDELRMYGNSSLGVFVASSMKIGNANMGMTNGGGVRAPLEKGDITYGDAISILPFQNQLNIVNISGTRLRETLKYGTRNYGKEAFGGYPIISGLSYTLDLSKDQTDDARITGMKLITNTGAEIEAIEDDQYYTLAVTDFTWQGGDGFDMLVDLPLVEQHGSTLDNFIQLIKALPDATVTGNEDFFGSVQVNVINEKQTRRAKRAVTPIAANVDNVVVENLFDAMSTEYGDATSFYDYTVSADKYIYNNASVMRAITGKNVSYVENGNIYFMASSGEYNYGADQFSEATPVGAPAKCSGLFKKLNSELECVTDYGYVVCFCVMIILCFVTVALVVIFLLYRRSQTLPKVYETNHMNDALNAD